MEQSNSNEDICVSKSTMIEYPFTNQTSPKAPIPTG